MAGRRKKTRLVGLMPEYVGFTPDGVGVSKLPTIRMTLDEFEVIRLVDLNGASQAEAAAQMGVARATVAGIYEQARHKLAEALVNGRRLVVEGGQVEFRPATSDHLQGWPEAKGGTIMRVAVTYENGEVFQHFGRTQQFKVYDIEDGKVASSAVVSSNGVSHGALAGLLAQDGVDVLVCGGIGGGALAALAGAGIDVHPGAQGSADQAVQDLLAGKLPQATDATCAGHGEGHSCGHGEDHGCGHDHAEGHSCGCH